MGFVDSSKIAISANRGRYSGVDRTPEAPGGLPRARGRRKPVQHRAAVVDPYGNGRDRIQVLVNRNVDVLEQEHAANRISEAAYETGRVIQDAFQHVGNCRSGSNWGSQGGGVDAYTNAEYVVVATLDRVRTAAKLMARVEQAVGTVGARFLRRVLVDSISFTEAAAERGRHGERAASYAGARFRDMLEDLSIEFGAKGKDQAQILASIAEEPDVVRVEDTAAARRVHPPIVHGQSAATKAIGRRTLALAVEASADSGATAGDVVRRGIRPRD